LDRTDSENLSGLLSLADAGSTARKKFLARDFMVVVQNSGIKRKEKTVQDYLRLSRLHYEGRVCENQLKKNKRMVSIPVFEERPPYLDYIVHFKGLKCYKKWKKFGE